MDCRCAYGFGNIVSLIYVSFLLLRFAISVRLSVTLCTLSGVVRARIMKFYTKHLHEKINGPVFFRFFFPSGSPCPLWRPRHFTTNGGYLVCATPQTSHAQLD